MLSPKYRTVVGHATLSSPRNLPFTSLTSSSPENPVNSTNTPGDHSLHPSSIVSDFSLEPSLSEPNSPATPNSQTLQQQPVATRKQSSSQLVLRTSPRFCLEGDERSLSEFEIGTTIGTGSFGRVCLVRLCNEPVKHKGYLALKVMKKSDVLRLKQVEHIVNEAQLLQTLSHPFIVSQICSFQDERRLYLLLEYVPGGELFSYLRNERVISDKSARFYASEIVLCYHYLHGLNIAYRDLKPENVLLTRTGHIKLADFGFAKIVQGRTWTLCGTPEYLAPEIIQNKGHGKSVDWWALGVLVFEMLAGFPPFFDDSAIQIYQKIVKGEIDFPEHFEPRVCDFIMKLLQSDVTKRLGCLKDGTVDVMHHEWFTNVKWQSVLDRLIPSPYFPPLEDAKDTSNFDVYEDADSCAPLLAKDEDLLFANFGPRVIVNSPLWAADIC